MKKNKTSEKGNKIGIIILIIFAVAVVIFALTDFITDIIWFGEVGYTAVFFTELVSKLKIGIPSFVIFTAVGFVAFTALKRNFLKKNAFELTPENKKKMRRVLWVVSGAIGLFVSVVLVGNLWFEILEYANASEFDITDPLFGNDIGFYMFKYGFLSGLADSAIAMVIAYIAGTVIMYTLLAGFAKPVEPASQSSEKTFEQETQEYYAKKAEGPFYRDGNGVLHINLSNKNSSGSGDLKLKAKAVMDVALKGLVALGVLFFLFVAFKIYVEQFNVLYDDSGLFYGAGFTEVNVMLWVYRALIVLSIVAAIMLVVAAMKKSIKLAVIVPAAMLVVGLLGGGAKTLVQGVIVDPDELSKERDYMAQNIKYTRLAYDIDKVDVKEIVPDNELSKVQVLDNMETFSNIRINDFDPTQLFYNQTQSIRSYYTFNDVDVDRYYVNGEYTQVFLSAREIDPRKTEDSWLIQHLKYTHGYGLTLSRVDKITSSGQPAMLIEGIPPKSEIPEIDINRPEIYYGELSDGYVITRTSEQEFDYPSGESNMYCVYNGTGGIRLTAFNRLLFSIREQSLKLLISGNINRDSRIMVYRNIEDRIEKIAPFLTYDNDPYVVTVDGKIYWIADGYTTSSKYPYSEPYRKSSDINYIRNSVKIVVDAYNGDVNFYICDEEDPIIQTLAKIYPTLFKSMSQMPESLKAHLQYPNAIFNIQAAVYERYHMTDVDVFYQNEDRWAIAQEVYGQAPAQAEATYSIMKLPGETSAEFVSTISFTPAGKSNLTGVLIARQDGDNYGKLVIYRMPKDRLIYGPQQIEAQVNQDSEISKEFSLWNNSGSTYSRGHMFVIPVENSLLYVEPVYLYASTGSLPEVKRVIVYYNETLAYESTLADALDALFGDGAGDPLNTAYPIVSGHEAAEALRKEIEEGGEPKPPVDDPQEPDDPTPEDPTLEEKLDDIYKQWQKLGEEMKKLLDQIKGE